MTRGKEIVFVVDDDLAVRESIKFSLQLEGLLVRVCATGAELLRHSDLPWARCLVLNVQTPITDTFEILDGLRALTAMPAVILITGRATSALRLLADAAGVRFILEKPLLDNSLLARIQEALGHSQQAMPPLG
jgi:two-component system response regulator FixJ